MGVNQFGYHIKEGFRSVFSHGLMSFASVCTIVVCLLIMGSFSLVALNIDSMLETLEDQNEVLAYIDENLDEEQARALESSILAIENVSGVTFMTREEAKVAFEEKQSGDLFGDVPADTFRHRFRVQVEDISLLAETVEQLRAVPGIEKTREEIEVAEGFVMLRNVVSILAIVLTVLLVIVSMFIISNTIRITTFTRREEIAIMKMCGATDWFIRWPFIFEGVIIGLFAGLLAFLLQWGFYGVLQTAIGNVANLSFVEVMPFDTVIKPILGIFSGVGLLIGACGSALAIRKFLRV